MKDTLIFDYDGTLNNTIKVYEPAFRTTFEWLISKGYAKDRLVTSEDISGWLGMNSCDMWNSFMPELPEEIKDKAASMVASNIASLILSHKASWYKGTEKVLTELKNRGYTMVILSNCRKSYKEANWKEFFMDRWFSDFYDCESYEFAPKTEIIHEIRKKYNTPFIIIGDRDSDFDCAKASNSIFIGCRYGFGKNDELKGSDYFIDDISEILKIIK